jgi:hypothetical protein
MSLDSQGCALGDPHVAFQAEKRAPLGDSDCGLPSRRPGGCWFGAADRHPQNNSRITCPLSTSRTGWLSGVVKVRMGSMPRAW